MALYDQAAQWLQQAMDVNAQLTAAKTLVREAPQRIGTIRDSLESPVQEMSEIEDLISTGNQGQIESVLTLEQTALQQARETHRKQSDELSRLLVGSKRLSEEIASRTTILKKIEADLETLPTDEKPTMLQALTLVLQSRRMLRQAELELFKLRLDNHDLLTNLAQAERDFASAEISERQIRLDSLLQAAQQLPRGTVQAGASGGGGT